jgi:hypothetical protein
MNLNDYSNPFTYASPKDDPLAFDIWANRNDLIQEQFSEDILTYMKTVLSETDFVDASNVIDKKLQNIVDIITNEKDTYEEQFWLALELLPLVV